MKIVGIEPILLTAPYGVSGAHIGTRSACFVRVHTDAGVSGLGETYAGVYVPELAARIVEFFAPYLVGLDAGNPNAAYRTAYFASNYVGRTGLTVMVLSGIENALWDVLGKAEGLPVHALLGGAVHARLPLYASGGTPTLSTAQLVAQAAEVRARGFRGYKMRANFFSYQPEVEAERVAAVRAAIGPDLLLALDAVQSFNMHPWSVKQAARMLRMLEPYDLAWAEEMLPPFDPRPYAELRALTSTPISGGEGITTAAQFEQWLRAGAFDLAQPDATIIGGIGEARRACEAAGAQGVPVAMHVWGSAPALAANYHLALTMPNCVMLERPVMGNPLETEMLVESFAVEDGHLLPPSAPGLGVELSDELRARYAYVPGSASFFG
ncbi:MAG TPA: mandelate racemase/muconate lactonizing enzyme family protein [Candidatus Dormibacteraeota bacterium]|nr:mandelate racemase/muconate lactonizing enzyme family protein [Candidatus Dormibacteraeota bacterium]